MAGKQQQVKQIWFTSEDEDNFRTVAEAMRGHGLDVEADNKRATSEYSYTKVIRRLLANAVKRPLQSYSGGGDIKP